MSNPEPLQDLKQKYESQYNDDISKWREWGGKQKALNLVELCHEFRGARTLDVGSGDGAVLAWLEDFKFTNELYSVEISTSGIEKIHEQKLNSLKEVKLFDGYTIPYGDKEFKLSTCSHVVEHVEHPRILLREIARVAEYSFFEIPIDFSLQVDKKIKHYLAYGHINIYTPALFKFLLKSEGFEVISEKFSFTSPEVLHLHFKGNQMKIAKQRFKNWLTRMIPLLKKVKPNAYAVLCKHSGKSLEIF